MQYTLLLLTLYFITTPSAGQDIFCPSPLDSRCLDCQSWVDCSSGSPVIRNCTNYEACGENPLISPPAFCSLQIQSTPDNGNCFCDGVQGLQEDPYTIESYVSCSGGTPTYLDCPSGQAFIYPEQGCVPVPECTSSETMEIPLSCGSKLVCEFEYGTYAGTLEFCNAGEIYNADEPNSCYVPATDICIENGNMADPYKCDVWHECFNDTDPVTSSCCNDEFIFSELLNDCERGYCEPSGLCIQEYWEIAECNSCSSNGEKYATDNICTEYYFECYISGGSGFSVRLAMCPSGQLFDPSANSCSFNVQGC